ncbi:hypothetical protein HYV86_06970 [Candidatus Woesearchaeota archaeon]|nr:hypothetical protein [Candidatus Woesearchaeota archaeon]
MQKKILEWTSNVQYRKGTPYVCLIKHLGKEHILKVTNTLTCKLMLIEGKLKVVIDLE